MGFDISISGLTAARNMLDVAGNNIANANTTAYKASRALFEDVYAAGSGGKTAVGLGVRTAEVQQQFAQGGIQSTSNALDLAVGGTGFFTLAKTKENLLDRQYTRAGAFHLDSDGYVVNSENRYLMGNNATGTPDKIQIKDTGGVPMATSKLSSGVNLDSRTTIPSVTTFDPTNSNSYNNVSSMLVYDSQGGSHTLTSYYIKTGTNTWTQKMYTPITDPATGTVTNTQVGADIPLVFKTDGTLDDATKTTVSALAATTTGLSPAVAELALTMDLTTTTQFGSTFSVINQGQDGYPKGILTGIAVDSSGAISANYSNGQKSLMGTVLLSRFNNPNGLQKIGENSWTPTTDSGAAVTGLPGSAGLGVIQSNSLEGSNVDLSAELVKLIVAQQAYQANSQSISVNSQAMQSVLQIR